MLCLPIIDSTLLSNLGENAFNLGIIFASCGLLSEVEREKNINVCLKTNLKIASTLFLTGSIINLYRINRI